MVGGSRELDACTSQGQVYGLSPKGDGFLSVRADPSAKGTSLDRHFNGDTVILCEKRGEWYGIVYGKSDCGVSSPINQKQPYKGACKQGWVFGKYIKIIAG